MCLCVVVISDQQVSGVPIFILHLFFTPPETGGPDEAGPSGEAASVS